MSASRAQRFHELHAAGRVLVLPNAWDAASARIVERAGATAIATTSAGIAWSLGYADGERLKADDVAAACARICRVTSLPVTVDVERGYGGSPGEVADVAEALLALGVVGVNIEDGIIPGASMLVEAGVLAERIAAMREMTGRRGVPMFLNARIDTYVLSGADSAARFDETLRRAALYIEAGADGIFVPGLTNLAEIARLAKHVTKPLNIYAGHEGVPSVADLKAAGVRRVSLGCGPLQALLARLQRIALEAIEQGSYAEMTREMLSAAEVNALFS